MLTLIRKRSWYLFECVKALLYRANRLGVTVQYRSYYMINRFLIPGPVNGLDTFPISLMVVIE